MKSIKTILSFALICCNTLFVSAQNITVDDTKTATDLVKILTNNSSCVTVFNAATTGDNLTPGENSYGSFNNSGGSFPFIDGVILNTWSINKAVGPFVAADNGGGSVSWGGDADLNLALNIGSINATSLEFDFTSLTNFISFNYIFASNEYQGNFPCRFSDGFAFLIKEVGTSTYQNLAVVPGTTTPVSSINVRPAIPSIGIQNGCPALNENYFNGFNSATSPINFGGQTVIMNAQTNVIAGKTYHIKIVIADDQTRYFDSAVFLQAGSFSPKIDLGQDRTSATNNPVCFGEPFTIDTKFTLSQGYSYQWFKDGSLTPIPGATNPTYTVSTTGIYKVEVTLSPTTCIASGEIKLEYTPEIIVSNTTLAQCDDNGDGKTIYDLTRVDNIVKNNNSALSPVIYFEFLSDAKANINPIINSSTYTNKSTNPILFARVTNSFGCANYAQVNLVIPNNNIVTQNPVSTCDGDTNQDGLYQFDLNAQVTSQVLSGLPPGLIVEYYLNKTDAVAQKNALPTIFKNTSPNQQIIYARIVNGPDCYGIVPITLVVNTFDPPNFQDETVIVCIGSKIDLSVASGYSGYLWNTGAITNTIEIKIPGSYFVKVTNANGCEKTKKFTVTASGIATITGATVNDFAGNENSVLLEYNGVGNYEFSLDGSYFQDNPLFIRIAPATYTAYARDKNGCGLSVPFLVYVLDYPRFFTPNGDGFNDVWEIENLKLFPNAVISIFDRYGKLLKQLNAVSSSWNGTYNGHELLTSDYWFSIDFGNGKIIKGHFTLKR